jgi:hypothetical protein
VLLLLNPMFGVWAAVAAGARGAVAAAASTVEWCAVEWCSDEWRSGAGAAVRPLRQAMIVARAAATAPASMAALVPSAVAATGSWLTAAAIAGKAAAPMAAPIWRLVLMTPPTTPCSAPGTPVVAMTIVPNAVPAVPKPTSMTAASSGV